VCGSQGLDLCVQRGGSRGKKKVGGGKEDREGNTGVNI
jgi:hypothetical protein